MILSRKRRLPVVMALLVRNWGTLLWTRPKGTQGRTADGEEPGGIENRDDGNGDSALAEGSNHQSELLILFDEIYDSEVAVVNLFFKICSSRTRPQQRIGIQRIEDGGSTVRERHLMNRRSLRCLS
jgi:hypothetical protein